MSIRLRNTSPTRRIAPHLTMSFHLRAAGLLCSFWCICATVLPMAHGAEPGLREKLNGGYYLLHHVSADEAQLPLLLDFKHAPPEISDFADQISKTAKKTVAVLEHLQEGDASIRFDRNPLPQIEQDVRDSIKAEKQHTLLFGTSNSAFVRALLVSQIEASTYAMNIAKVLAGEETDSDRARALRHLSAEWDRRRMEAVRLLGDY